MESQPQNPEFRINPENFHPCKLVTDLKSSLASSNFCSLLILFANSLDPDQNVGPYLDPNHLTLIVFLKEFLL